MTFSSGDTSKTFTFSPVDDTEDDDGEKVKLAFGTHPPGVSSGSTSSTTISINDNDDPEVKVQFGSATYSITEPGSVTVKLTLDADPEREVVIPLSADYGNDATSADFSGVAGSVTFDSGETSKTFSVSTGDDFIDRNGRSATLSFGSLPARVTEGDVEETVISIKDSDVRGANVFPTTLTIAEDGTGTYTVNLLTEPTSAVTFTINNPTDNTEASAEPASITFDASNFSSPKTVTVTVADDDLDEATETATVTHTITGGDYGAKGVTAADVVVTMTDDDETPVISGSSSPTFREIAYDADAADVDLEIATYSASDGDGDDITWSVGGTDSAGLSITENADGKGVLSFSDAPDFENPSDSGSNNTYVVTVEASDGTNTGTRAVTVTVTNFNERPIVRPLYQGEPNVLGGRELAESSYEVVPAEVRSVGTFRGRDEEGQGLTWALSGADAAWFRFETKPNPNEIEVFFRNPPDYENPTDLHEVNQYHFTVRASDGSNTGAWDFLVLIYDINEPPTIRADTVPDYMEIEWDFTGTPPPVHTFTATDPEGDAIQWIMGTVEDYPEITGIVVANHDGEAFTMGRMTGVMTFNPSTVAHTARGFPNFEAPRDYGADNVWDVVVRATDGEAKRLTGLFTQIYVQVRVINVNEKPGFLGDPATAISQDENELASEILADYNARDEEGDVTWSLTGTDRSYFDLSTDGVLTFTTSPNFEDLKIADADTTRDFAIGVVATDTMSGTTRRNASLDVTVTLNDLEEDGVITVSNVNPGVGESVRFELSDPDGGIQVGATNGFLWTVQGRTSDTSPWQEISSSNTGQLFFVFTAQEEHTGQQVRAVVDAYEDRRGTGKSAESEPTAAVTRDPIANAPPRLRTPAAYAIAEGAAGASARARRSLGQPLHVTDRDGDTLTFAIAPGANSGLFAVDASTGQLWAVQDLGLRDAAVPVSGRHRA